MFGVRMDGGEGTVDSVKVGKVFVGIPDLGEGV
jgi:hypothetical protein